MSLLAQRAQAWLAKNERAESLIVIGAWAGAYYGMQACACAGAATAIRVITATGSASGRILTG